MDTRCASTSRRTPGAPSASWIRWRIDSDDSLRDILITDLRAILVVVLTAVFLYMLPGSQLARARGTISQFFAGWASYIFAAGFAAAAFS